MREGGYIYAVGIEGVASMKIGKTTVPVAKRLAALQQTLDAITEMLDRGNGH